MTQRNNSATQSVHPAPIGKRMLQGAGIALILIITFLLSAGDPKHEWGKLWMIKPLVVVPSAGALGGAFYYFMDHLRGQGGWRMVLAVILSLIGHIILLWLGMVLGLNGTWWD